MKYSEIYKQYPEEEMLQRAKQFTTMLSHRRTVREFSTKPIPQPVLQQCLLTAGTAPSGANQQPWHFVAITNTNLKRKIRIAAEEIEQQFYSQETTKNWVQDLQHLPTNQQKTFLEEAPALIAIFAQNYSKNKDGTKNKHYYVSESVNIAIGMLLAALQNVGLATLTYTPAPMTFLSQILNTPQNERPVMIIVTGYPKQSCQIPNINKKSLNEYCDFIN